MPDEAHNLRDIIAAHLGRHLIADPPKRGVTGNSMADEVMRVLRDHPLAVMQTLGTVREGWADTYRVALADDFYVGTDRAEAEPTDQPVFVVSIDAAPSTPT